MRDSGVIGEFRRGLALGISASIAHLQPILADVGVPAAEIAATSSLLGVGMLGRYPHRELDSADANREN